MIDFDVVKELFLERDWNRDGKVFHHRQVFANGSVYVYEVSKPCGAVWYEVFKRRIVPDVAQVDGKLTKLDDRGHVKYPSDEDFGRWAKNCVSFNIGSDDRFDAGYWVDKWSQEAQI